MAVLVKFLANPGPAFRTTTIAIDDCALILELDDENVEDEIYSPAAGRIFNDAWGRGKTPTALISNPVDIIEHCKRLQNWSETAEIGITWGKQYATSALIKTSGAGSFDDVSLNDVKTFSPSWQIFDKDKSYSNEIVKYLCKTYDLCTRIDEQGNECIYTIDRTYPTETVQFSDIVGDIGELQEPAAQDIYCEPVVNYLYDDASGKYKKPLAVTDIAGYAAGGTWSDCCNGFASESDALTILGPCVDLYDRFKYVEKCPSDFSDKVSIKTYADALHYLQMKLDHMGRRRISVSVNYPKGKSYYYAMHVLLKLPHQTKTYELECIVENITKSKNKNLVTMQLIILDDIALSWQNTVDTGTEYQDSETTGTEYQAISA